MVAEWRIASKAILPLPNLHNELSEETRVRSRYLDLIAREQARATVRARPRQGGRLAARRPSPSTASSRSRRRCCRPCTAAHRPARSSTHSNAFDTELFLRIAPELFLKRAVVGGIDRVFEINRNFRNEGADSTHSPEFAMLEAYQAYGDYNPIADLTQELIQNAALAVAGSHVVTWADGTEYDLGGEWDRISMYESLSRCRRRRDHPADPDRRARGARRPPRASRCDAARPTASTSRSCGSTSSRAALVRPTFVMDFPRRHLAARARAPHDPRRRREVGPLHPRLRAGHRLLRARRPGHPARALRRAGASSRPAATPRRCASTRSSSARSSTACRRPAAWAWASTGC